MDDPKMVEQMMESEKLKKLEEMLGPDSPAVIAARAAYRFKWAGANERAKKKYRKYRATVVIIDNGKVLLVRDSGRHDFSLPGGGYKKGESTIQAGPREVFEELGIKAHSVERLRQCDLDGQRAYHKVCKIVMDNEQKPYLKSKEIDKFIWWDMQSSIPVQGHVKYILGKLGFLSQK